MTSKCPYCGSERYVNEDGGVICDRCGATFLTEDDIQRPDTFVRAAGACVRLAAAWADLENAVNR